MISSNLFLVGLDERAEQEATKTRGIESMCYIYVDISIHAFYPI
jgi:hypothetical protein